MKTHNNISIYSKYLLAVLDKVKWFGLRKVYWVARNFYAQERIRRNWRLVDESKIKRLVEVYGGYGGQNVEKGAVTLGFGLIHYALVRNVRPKRILCVGSQRGFIPAICAIACKENGFGKVDFVDAAYDESDLEHYWDGRGFWKKNDPVAHFKRAGVAQVICTYVMTTKDFAIKYPMRKYDYIYIDGDHSYEGVKLDYNLFWPRLNMNGVMLFHDISETGQVGKGVYGVRKFWREVKNTNSFELPMASGLGIMKKT